MLVGTRERPGNPDLRVARETTVRPALDTPRDCTAVLVGGDILCSGGDICRDEDGTQEVVDQQLDRLPFNPAGRYELADG